MHIKHTIFIFLLCTFSAQSELPHAHMSAFETTVHHHVYSPKTVEELQEFVKIAYKNNHKICIVGAGKSQGGQTTSTLAAHQINLQHINTLLSLDTVHKQVTVQAGMTWKQLQQLIAPHGLAVKAMQSYNDFSIGGSLSVNVHGQSVQDNPLIKSVKSCTLLRADGELITISRTEHGELFNLVIGGYGLCGIITEVTLHLTDNVLMKRVTKSITPHQLSDYFSAMLKKPGVQFCSARFSVGPSDLLEKVLAVSYETVDEHAQKLSSDSSSYNNKSFNTILSSIGMLLRTSDLLKDMRFTIEKYYFGKDKIISRNAFMNFSVDGLPKDDKKSSYILQEYFIPYAHVNTFVSYLKGILRSYHVNILNITARHVNQDTESVLSYASQDCCAFVLYLNIAKSAECYASTVEWTRKLIDKTIALQGTYYLPYHLIATPEQICKTYPQLNTFIALKKQYDPQELFTNSFYEAYRHVIYA